MLSKIINWLILILLFLLPWQTRWIYEIATLNGLTWEYGTLGLYGTEILLWIIIILTSVKIFSEKLLWKKISSYEHLKKRWINLVFAIVFIFFISYSWIISPVVSVTNQFLNYLLGGICLMLAIVLFRISQKKVFLTMWLSGVVQGVFAIYQFLTQKVVSNKWLGLAEHDPYNSGTAVIQFGEDRWLRAYGSFGWPNSLGIYLAVLFVLGFIIYFYSKPKYRLFALVGQMIILVGLLFSFSRNAWISAFVGVTSLLIIIFLKYNKKKLKEFIYPVTILIILSLLIIIACKPLFVARFNTGNYLEKLSITERTSQLIVAKTVITQNLFFGVGPGLYTYYLSQNYPAPVYGSYQPVHNIYLLILAEVGILFFGILLGVLIFLGFNIWKVNPLYLAVVITLLISGMLDHFLWSLYVGQVFFWIVLGVGLVGKRE